MLNDKAVDPVRGIVPDDEVVYGKVDGLGHAVHVSELGEVVTDA